MKPKTRTISMKALMAKVDVPGIYEAYRFGGGSEKYKTRIGATDKFIGRRKNKQ